MKRNETATTGLSLTRAESDTSVGRGCLVLSRAEAANLSLRDRATGRQGSALILVLVCLVMMVLIGTAYIQVARVDRRATAQLTGVNNLDTVRDAVIAYMAKVLKEDLLDSTGVLFNPAAYDESHDYPFTNRDASFAVTSGKPSTVGNSLSPAAAGGRFDDTWLASTYVDPESVPFSGFSHISNLNGIFLRMPKASGEPLEQPMDAAGLVATAQGSAPMRHDGYGDVFDGAGTPTLSAFRTVYTLPIIKLGDPTAGNINSLDYAGDPTWDMYGVDTDGDGILDARWTWAPEEVRQIGGLTYVVAYRIIDLSSMVNVNTATAISNDGATVPALSDAPRGYWPTDVDLSRLLSKSRSSYAGWVGELGEVLAARGLPATLPTPPGDLTFNGSTGIGQYSGNGHRGGAWNDASIGSKYYGFTNDRFVEDSELELRSRGGLNTATDAPIENAMSHLLRRTSPATTEVTFKEVPGIASTASDLSVFSFMHGATTRPNDAGSGGVFTANRTLPAIRQLLTTMSGASEYARQYPGWIATSELDRLKYDLVQRGVSGSVTLTPAQRAQEIADRLTKIFNVGPPKYLGLTDVAVISQIATEFALAIQDCSDADSTPTGVAVGGTTYYGLEIMPFLREFYVQGAYESDMPDMAATPPVYKERKFKAGSGAFVIEIGNPFDKNCSFAGGGAGVSLRVRILKEGSATELVSYEVPPAVEELPPRDGNPITEQMVFYSTPTTPAPDANGKGTDLLADLSLDTTYAANRRREITIKLPDSAFDDSPLTVELQVEVSSGVFITYDRLRDPAMKLPAKYVQDNGDAVTAVIGHSQITLKRDGEKNRYLSNRGRAVVKADASTNIYLANGTLSKFGADNKSVTGDSNLDKIQLAHSDHQIFNVAELGYIFMYGFFDGDEGDLPSRISGKDGSKGTGVTTNPLDTACPARHFLSLTADGSTTGAVVVPYAGSLDPAESQFKVPHMGIVMDQFTTISARYDGIDNDGDGGIDNQSEQFVPGMINVNTMPVWLMAYTSPLPETNQDVASLYQAITDYRDWPASRQDITGVTGLGIDHESDKGVRSIGELMLIKSRKSGAVNPVTQMRRYGEDSAVLSAGSPLRLYPNPDDDKASIYVADEYPAQERMLRFQFLTNNLTTRSDRYCAYVVIRGYNSTNFSGAPSESLRFFVLLDRSKVIDLDSAVGVYPKTGQKN